MVIDLLTISPTRSELLELRRRRSLASKGYLLLKKKQDVLIQEFFKIVKEYQNKRKELIDLLKETYKNLSLSISYTGIFVFRSLAYSTQQHFDISIEQKVIMGTEIPIIQLKNLGKELDHVYDNSPLVADSMRRFHTLFEKMIELANMEQVIRSKSEEIKRIRRRVNSLEQIQLPRFDAAIGHIQFVLDEQERDSFVRLKMIKRRLDAQHEA